MMQQHGAACSHRQQELLDRSHQRAQRQRGESRSAQETEAENQSDARNQEGLRRDLGEMMRRLGEALGDIPRPMGRAEQAMRDARDALRGNEPGEALDPQSRAIDQLQQGMQAMAEAFMEQMGEQPGRGQGPVGMTPGFGRDPLGRETGQGRFEATEGVELPGEMDLQRAREILNELRRRRGQQGRPTDELDYIDRLLRQF